MIEETSPTAAFVGTLRPSTLGPCSGTPSLLAAGASTFLGVKEGSGCADAHPVLLTSGEA